MKLRRIKLSGFKSFVDATTIDLPGQLVGVVGPNGCGKSNVVDALRWVLGESSARQLRGENMMDVIFNGSQHRAPVSRAQVELRFDNQAGRALGPFAAYQEIAVKRELGRDAVSAYSINQTRCRKRDVADLFLGTGLGPRAYAIIEQGMISRIIEARPEELRNFLEEASGVSRYRERRRETLARIEQTRENLSRVNDLREELGGQLKRLERQAEAAARFRRLKAEERQLQAERLRHRLAETEAEAALCLNQMGSISVEIEAALAQQRSAEADALRLREQARSAQIDADAVQAAFYASAADLARLEQQLQHLDQEAARLRAEIVQVENDAGRQSQRQDSLTADLAEGEKRLQALEARGQALREEESGLRATLKRAEEALNTSEQEARQVEQEGHQFRRELQVQETRLEQLRARSRDLEQRGMRLQAESSRPGPGTDRLASLRQQSEQLTRVLESAQEQLTELGASQQGAKAALHAAESRHDKAREAWQTLRAAHQAQTQRVSSLSRPGEGLVRLAGQLPGEPATLLASLAVAPGWERAVEAVLGWRLKALLVDDLSRDLPLHWLEKQQNGQFAVLETSVFNAPIPARKDLDPLLDKVRGPDGASPALPWLAGVFCADSLDAALSQRHQLGENEFWVTPEGILVGRHAYVWDRGQSADSVLELREHLQKMALKLAGLEAALTQAVSERETARNSLAGLEAELQKLRVGLQQGQSEKNRVQVELARLEAEEAAHLHRQEQIHQELAQIDTEGTRFAQERQEAESAAQAAASRLRSLDDRLKSLEAARQAARQQVQTLRQEFSRLRDSLHQLELQTQQLRTELKGKAASLEDSRAQRERAQARLDTLAQTLAGHDASLPALQSALQDCLSRRQVLEQSLQAAQNAVEGIEAELRQREQTGSQAAREAESRRERHQALALQLNTATARQENLQEQLDAVLPYLGQDEQPAEIEALDPAAIDARLEQLGNRIAALGNVNLAAIEEHAQVAERKGYLDAQHADLEGALDTLESAIRRMDKETRDRFRKTFETVNANFQTLFPRLFGGGEAQMTLTDDNLLEAGVSVIARPPGKRNSSIQLLSGGEKALTAVALVFAMFQLNPAPFCVLDEVDAPLDEANVGRFCDMVREMSVETQFLFITHNKVTMQLATHLIGVTMAEPGVSRIVSVDVEQAMKMAGAA
ncbi:chromosome segregation protein SMC [Thermithiobacillus plumbiphilus]|uniref:Chromosome partition protein Smc n=1 Tax=Thermithiobacillus plumbiphilus TaxID=1729899 RepID=A0ABU9D714_9PROT